MLTLETAADLAHISAPPMLIKDLIPEGSLIAITGPSFSGKTFVALELARAVAFNTPFMHRWPVISSGNVLLIESDSPKWDTGLALRAMLKDDMTRLSAQTNGSYRLDALKIAWHPFLNIQQSLDTDKIINTALSLYTTLGWWGTQEKTFEGCHLLIMDTLRRIHQGDEDSSTEMNKILFEIDRIRKRTSSTIAFLHHEPKSARTPLRGSNVIEGNCDFVIRVTKKKGLSKASFIKGRGELLAESTPDFKFSISKTKGGRKEVKFHSFIDKKEEPVATDPILETLANGPMSAPAIAESLNQSISTIYRRLRRLETDALITKQGSQYHAS